jgi:carbon monoxide dehydrogenase subunit G
VSVPQNFPGVASFETLSPHQYLWCFEPIRYGQYEYQVKLRAQLSIVDTTTFRIDPIPGDETSQIRAEWKITNEGGSTWVDVQFNLTALLPVPSLLKGVVAPLAQKELSRFFDRYCENAKKSLAK